MAGRQAGSQGQVNECSRVCVRVRACVYASVCVCLYFMRRECVRARLLARCARYNFERNGNNLLLALRCTRARAQPAFREEWKRTKPFFCVCVFGPDRVHRETIRCLSIRVKIDQSARHVQTQS